MSKTLFIFVTSERPDQYLNPVVHCLLYEQVSSIIFVHIKNFGGVTPINGSNEKGISGKVSRNVQMLLESLSKGVYRFFDSQDDKTVDLKNIYIERIEGIKEIYKQCLDIEVNWSHRDIDYLDLRKKLALAKKEGDCIFDITAIGKSFLGDILAASIIEGINNLFTFELKTKPNFDEPWTILFHDLKVDGGKNKYQYVNIVNTPIFKECSNSLLVRTPSLIISLIVAFLFLVITLIVYFFYGEMNSFLQITFIASSVISFLSLYFNFFPPRR